MKNNIKKVTGLEKIVYSEIGPIVMSKEGMDYFDNYPVITSKDHHWILLYLENKLAGFAAVLYGETVFEIRNVYGDLDELLPFIMVEFEKSDYKKASCFVKVEHVSKWKSLGFEISGDGKNWVTMHKIK